MMIGYIVRELESLILAGKIDEAIDLHYKVRRLYPYGSRMYQALTAEIGDMWKPTLAKYYASDIYKNLIEEGNRKWNAMTEKEKKAYGERLFQWWWRREAGLINRVGDDDEMKSHIDSLMLDNSIHPDEYS